MKKIRFKSLVAVVCCLLLPLQVIAAEPGSITADTPKKIITENGYLERVSDTPIYHNGVQPRYQYKVVTDGGNLNVRDYPSSTTGNVIGSLANGTIIEIPFMQPSWIPDGWEYTTSPIEGYVASQYIGNI